MKSWTAGISTPSRVADSRAETRKYLYITRVRTHTTWAKNIGLLCTNGTFVDHQLRTDSKDFHPDRKLISSEAYRFLFLVRISLLPHAYKVPSAVCDVFVCLFVPQISLEPLNGFTPNSQ